MLNLIHSINKFVQIFALILSFLLLSRISNFGQSLRVEKIRDSNLFELSDGSRVKLALIDVPNINHPNPFLKTIGIKAFNYGKQILLGRKVQVEYSDIPSNDSLYLFVRLYREYPLTTIDYAEKFLEKGFAKFYLPSNPRIPKNYMDALHEAEEDQKGIWENESRMDSVYDHLLLGKGEIVLNPEEYIDSADQDEFLFMSTPTNSERIFYEILAAPILGFPAIFLGVMAGAALSSVNGDIGMGALGYVVVGGYAGYAFGSALGVYMVAKNGAREINFGETLAASFFGAVLGAGFYYTSDSNLLESDIHNILLFTLPGLSAILYANLVADPKINDNHTYSHADFSPNKILSHKDLYNSKKYFEINVLKINF